MPDQRTRRQAVALLGAGVSAGLAGCFSVTQSESTGASDDPTPTQTAESPQPTSVPPAVDSHLAPADNYDGSVVDARGQDTVTVTVATQANGGAFGFGPPAVHVDNGTTVQWE